MSDKLNLPRREDDPLDALSRRVDKLEELIRRAAPFVNSVAVMADDKTAALAWLADAAMDE